MATKTQRARAILEALADGTVDDARLDRVGNAFAAEYASGQTLTNAQKAAVILQHIRNFVKERVRNAEVNAAVATARATAQANADIDIGTDGSE